MMARGETLVAKIRNRVLWCLTWLSLTWSAAADDALRLLPSEITLQGPEARHRVLVHRLAGDELAAQVSAGVEWKSGDPSIVAVDGDVLRPVANGTTQVTAAVGGQTASISVTVSAMEAPHAWTFRQHVQAVLAKSGCNSGACHGALAGTGG